MENIFNFNAVVGIEKIQQEMLRLLDYTDLICKKLGLQYFLVDGTQLGAIRHKGFIPWDDDIDIGMTKSDCLKLVEYIRNDNNDDFYITPNDSKFSCGAFRLSSRSPYLRCFDNNFFPLLWPIKMDIVEFNVIEDTKNALEKERLCKDALKYIMGGGTKNINDNNKIIDDFGGKNKFLEFYNIQYGMADITDNSLLSRATNNRFERIYSVNEIFPLKKVSFENSVSYIPNTDVALKKEYGDYMTLPPECERVSYSKRVFEVKNKKNIVKIYKQFGLENVYDWSVFNKRKNLVSLFERIKRKFMLRFLAKEVTE